MKITINKKALIDTLMKMKKLYNTTDSHTILAYVNIVNTCDKVHLTFSGNKTQMTEIIQAEVNTSGFNTIAHIMTLYKLVKNIPGVNVTISYDESDTRKLEISTEEATAKHPQSRTAKHPQSRIAKHPQTKSLYLDSIF